MSENREVILEAKHVTRRFAASHGRTLLANNDISLKMYKGETLGLVGESGCGKSTFMRFLVSLDTPSEGEILYRGTDITKLKGEELRNNRQNIQMVFQDPTLSFNPKMKIRDIVCEPLMNFKKIRKSEKDSVCRKLLEMVELPGDFADRYPHNMSGGQRQRVAIARALASDPQILLCDEATSALDPQTTSSILELLQDINQKFGITIVIITHQMSVVREICTHVAIMKDGEVKEQGLVEEIFSHPKSQVAKELISKDSGNDVESKKLTQSEIQDGEIVRIVFSENSAFEPVIANLILTFHEPVNILKANTKNVGGVAKGEMILQFMSDSTNVPEMKKFLTERGLEIGEAN